MILSEFIRVMNIGWRDFLHMSFWILLFLGVLIGGVYSSAFGAGIAWYKKNKIPKLNKDQKEEIRKLNIQLKTAINERDLYKGKLMIAKKDLGVL